MKLVRYGQPGAERPGLIDAQGILRDLSAHARDIDGASLNDGLIARLHQIDPESLPVVEGAPRLGPCVAGSSKIVCIGLNYVDHAREGGREIPKEPLLFLKAPSSITGPNDPILIPRGSERTDWEIELAIIIGKDAHYVDEAHALDHVAGYALANDISERDHQLRRGGEWTKGKSHDTFCPLGPWLATTDELGEAGDIALTLEVNGVERQNGHTSNLIFGVAHAVAYISLFMTLKAGDIILTGTPAGVGQSIKPDPVFLGPGDVMTMAGSGLGRQSHEFQTA
ncbi:fumarylacetoacetate hydrolase family protein [Pseudaminobacter salicylatoxidans]|uniref:fumarylacetoacetate hydrolase family protein n=1 Tax=Pseudaminobacter salicylatoxidans TaxID=93369 RepID=UPI0003027475|nr:fumarylacetoacetate hydrolase family protein [Pseudaminobacter salicylatoxidans]